MKLDWSIKNLNLSDETREASFLHIQLEVEREEDPETRTCLGFDWALYDEYMNLIAEADEFEDTVEEAMRAAEFELHNRLALAAMYLSEESLRPASESLEVKDYPFWQPALKVSFSKIDDEFDSKCGAGLEYWGKLHPADADYSVTGRAVGDPLITIEEIDEADAELAKQAEKVINHLMAEGADYQDFLTIYGRPPEPGEIDKIREDNKKYRVTNLSGYDQILAQIKREAEEVEL